MINNFFSLSLSLRQWFVGNRSWSQPKLNGIWWLFLLNFYWEKNTILNQFYGFVLFNFITNFISFLLFTLFLTKLSLTLSLDSIRFDSITLFFFLNSLFSRSFFLSVAGFISYLLSSHKCKHNDFYYEFSIYIHTLLHYYPQNKAIEHQTDEKIFNQKQDLFCVCVFRLLVGWFTVDRSLSISP